MFDIIDNTNNEFDVNSHLNYDSIFNCKFVETNIIDVKRNKSSDKSYDYLFNNIIRCLKDKDYYTELKITCNSIRIIDKNYDNDKLLVEICINMDGKYYYFKYNNKYNIYQCTLKNENKVLYTFMFP